MILEDGTNPLTTCIYKTYCNIKRLEPVYPRYPHAVHGRKWTTSGEEEWNTLTDGYWTAGFLPGILFLCYSLTKDPELKAAAMKWMKPLECRAVATELHDIGFLFFPSAALGADITGSRALRKLALTAADSLTHRFQPDMGFLNVHDSPKYRRVAAVDTMMNLPLLWWAWKRTGDEKYRRPAAAHAENTWRKLVRRDGSTIHILRFQSRGGRIASRESWQGLAPESCWARGHAWAVAGFAHAFAFTGEAVYLERFRVLLDYYRRRRPADFVPLWDYDDPAAPSCEKDSSAAAILAHGLTTVYAKTRDAALLETANEILHALVSRYTTPSSHPAFLKRVCFHKPACIDPDTSSIYADYFYLRAIHDLAVMK